MRKQKMISTSAVKDIVNKVFLEVIENCFCLLDKKTIKIFNKTKKSILESVKKCSE